MLEIEKIAIKCMEILKILKAEQFTKSDLQVLIRFFKGVVEATEKLLLSKEE